jgi:hypothetical protein
MRKKEFEWEVIRLTASPAAFIGQGIAYAPERRLSPCGG